MEAKYIYNFRKFNSYSFEQLKFIAKENGITYTHPRLSKRDLAKKLAVISYHLGADYKSEFMEVD